MKKNCKSIILFIFLLVLIGNIFTSVAFAFSDIGQVKPLYFGDIYMSGSELYTMYKIDTPDDTIGMLRFSGVISNYMYQDIIENGVYFGVDANNLKYYKSEVIEGGDEYCINVNIEDVSIENKYFYRVQCIDKYGQKYLSNINEVFTFNMGYKDMFNTELDNQKIDLNNEKIPIFESFIPDNKYKSLEQFDYENTSIRNIKLSKYTGIPGNEFNIEVNTISSIHTVSIETPDKIIDSHTIDGSREKCFKFNFQLFEQGIYPIRIITYNRANEVVDSTYKFIHIQEPGSYIAVDDIRITSLTDGGSSIEFTAYNRGFSIATVEIINSDNNVVEVKRINALQLSNSIWEGIIDWGKNLTVGNYELLTGKLTTLTNSTNNKITKVKFDLPKGGSFRVVQSPIYSNYVAGYNFYDLFFKYSMLVKDVVTVNDTQVALNSVSKAAQEVSIDSFVLTMIKDKETCSIVKDEIMKSIVEKGSFDAIKNPGDFIASKFEENDKDLLGVIIDQAALNGVFIIKELFGAAADNVEEKIYAFTGPLIAGVRKVAVWGAETGEICAQIISIERQGNTKDIVLHHYVEEISDEDIKIVKYVFASNITKSRIEISDYNMYFFEDSFYSININSYNRNEKIFFTEDGTRYSINDIMEAHELSRKEIDDKLLEEKNTKNGYIEIDNGVISYPYRSSCTFNIESGFASMIKADLSSFGLNQVPFNSDNQISMNTFIEKFWGFPMDITVVNGEVNSVLIFYTP